MMKNSLTIDNRAINGGNLQSAKCFNMNLTEATLILRLFQPTLEPDQIPGAGDHQATKW